MGQRYGSCNSKGNRKRKMRKWDILMYPHPTPEEPHPAIIISSDQICGRENIDFVNVLIGQSVRPLSRAKKDNEVYLNSADGLDGKTLFKCDIIFQAKKNLLFGKKGTVSPQRVEEIRVKFREFF